MQWQLNDVTLLPYAEGHHATYSLIEAVTLRPTSTGKLARFVLYAHTGEPIRVAEFDTEAEARHAAEQIDRLLTDSHEERKRNERDS